MPRSTLKLFLLLMLLYSATAQNSGALAAGGPSSRHWEETASETLWRGRYNNCDYGYYVHFDAGVVAHDSLPPSPNHGFMLPLAELSRTTYSLDERTRFISVDASYDVSEPPVSQVLRLRAQVQRSGSGKATYPTLAGLPATDSSKIGTSPQGETFDESIVAVRAGIVYTIQLHTRNEFKVTDEKMFRRIVEGFKLLKLPKGECSND
jgi:hypothetical protein